MYVELSLCNEWGIPHSEFLEWSADDRSKAIAFVMEKASRCDMCGTADWEWEENRRAYEPIENFCMGCYMKTVYGEDSSNAPGVTIRLAPTNTIEHAKRLVKERKRALIKNESRGPQH